MMSIIRSNNSINPEESYKTIDNYGFDKDALCMFIQNYEVVKELKQENRNGTHFNRVGPNKNITGKGCYYIPYWSRIARRGYRNARNLFYKYCAYHLFYGKMEEYKTDKTDNFINFAQYLPKISPLCLDFDIVAKFTKEDRSKFKKGDDIHIYKQEHIYKIVEILNNIIFDNFEVDKDDIKAYVFEKESFKFKNAEEVKDGIHIIYLLPFNVKQRWFIRQELINKLIEINFINSFDFHITNDYNDIVDEAVITRNPWLTYGSVKVETKTAKDASGNTIYYTNKKGEKRKKLNCTRSTAYTLSYIFDFELFDENIDCMGNRLTYETIDDMEAMLNLFDLDQFSDDDPLKEKSDKLISFTYEENTKKHKNNTQKSNNNNNKSDYNNQVNYDEKIDYNYNLNKEVLFDIVNVLKKNEDLYTSYQNWYKICCSLYRNSKDCNIPDKDIKDAIYKFSSNSKSFNPEDFEDDYDNIIKGASKANYNYSLKYILDCIDKINPDKSQKIKKSIYSNLSKDNNLTKSFSFNNYKNNSLNIMDSSDSYFDEKILNNNQLSIIDRFEELENNFYEQHKNDEIKVKTKDIKEPLTKYEKNLNKIKELISKIKITKGEIIDLVCHYIDKNIIFVQGKEYYYVYDFEKKIYEPISKRILHHYLLKDNTDIPYTNKNNKEKTLKINPYTIFLNYTKYNYWIMKYDITKSKIYEEIETVDGKPISTRKIFNDGPNMPKYLTENYKHFDDYDQKYKDFVKGVFLLFRYSLCNDNEKDFEYLKNWVMNKTLLRRNQTILVLQSPAQGVGKSTVAQLFKGMFENYVFSSNKCDWLYENRFNSVLKDKIIVCIEEMKRTESKSIWLSAYSKLKDLTTNKTTWFEFKGKEAFECNIYFDFIIDSNIYNNLLIEVENRRYFIPTVTTSKYKVIPTFKPVDLKGKEIKTVNDLCNYVNGIINNKKNTDIPLEQKERIKYFRCFYAYCNDNDNKENFDPSNIPITDTVIQNNDKTMDVIYKYVKIKELYGKKHLITDREGNKLIKIVLSDLKEPLTDFVTMLDQNNKNLEHYNYSQHPIINFKHALNKPRLEITTNFLTGHMKEKFGEEYVREIKIKQKNAKCQTFIISYDDLLDMYYKKLGYVDTDEYEKLKGNYEKIKYCDNIPSDFSYYSQIEELKEKMEDKDDLINKYIDEIKDKDNMIESLKSFTNEQKDKEIEKLNVKIKELEELLNTKDNVITENNNVVNSKDKEIEELNAKIKELEEITNAKDSAITEDKEIEKSNDIVKENDNTNINKYREIMNKDIKDITIQTLRSIANECKIELDKHIFKYKKQELYDLLKKHFNNY